MRTILLAAPIGLTLLVALGTATPAEAQRPIPINIESTPAGATIYVDSTDTAPVGTTPARNVRVPRGNHTLIFQKDGYEEGRLPVNVRRWRETFRIVLDPLGTIQINAGNEAAQSAAVRIDGEAVGNIPYRGTVQPGRHLIQVGKEGYVTFSQWAEISGGQVMTLPVMLQEEEPETGSIMVGGDVSGAPVYLDGDPRGVTPTVIENVPAGEHELEIRPEDLDPHTQTVRVIAGERITVNPTIRPTPAPTGSLRVLANVPGAVVSLDGETLGEAPVSSDEVSPGEHILEARAEGYQTVQQPVTVESGQRRVVSLELEAVAGGTGRILIDAPVGDAIVTIDGEERGSPPVVIDDPDAGTHTIVVEAEGYEDFRTTCETGPGRDCEITAQLQPVGTPVRVSVPDDIRNAELYIDGELVGPIPYEGNLPIGEHRLEVRAPGYQDYVRQVNLVASSSPRDFDVPLIEEGEMGAEERARRAEELQRMREGATSHSAAPLVADLAILDVSVGWPYLAELRLNVGMLDFVEAGFSMRTFGRLTEFEGRALIGARPIRQLSVGLAARFGGGIGPARDAPEREMMRAEDMMQDAESHDVNSVYFLVEALGTLHFADAGAFTLWTALDLTTDQYDWLGEDSNFLVVSDHVDDGELMTGVGDDCEEEPDADDLRDGRQNLARLRLGGSLELVINRHWNVWAMLEGIIAGTDRHILGDIYGIGAEDTELYVRLGLTHKF